MEAQFPVPFPDPGKYGSTLLISPWTSCVESLPSYHRVPRFPRRFAPEFGALASLFKWI